MEFGGTGQAVGKMGSKHDLKNVEVSDRMIEWIYLQIYIYIYISIYIYVYTYKQEKITLSLDSHAHTHIYTFIILRLGIIPQK